tara:strand:- start:3258 stop:4394 length:1137 start_codon:yes stop_codon:yes gene_type:complete
MKSIGIITILKVNNYGAELQAFALQNFLAKIGYKSEIIDYAFYKNPQHIKTKKSKSSFNLSLKKRLKEFLYPVFNKIITIKSYKTFQKRSKRFLYFHQRFSVLSSTFRKIEDLYNADHKYDVFIVGSDQVWNPNNDTNLEPYFLKFAPDGSVKISYASSFGVDKIPEKYHKIYAKYLCELSSISVRENSGVNLVKKMSARDCALVLDPTFLLNKKDWTDFSTQINYTKKYLLIYVFNKNSYITELAKSIAKEKQLEIVRICKSVVPSDKNLSIKNILDAGPSEFLAWFKNASYILTTSFHGACFSINFNISFNVILEKGKDNNSRQVDLLNEFNISDRIVFLGDKSFNSDFVSFENVNKLLKKYKSNSIKYLEDSIGK